MAILSPHALPKFDALCAARRLQLDSLLASAFGAADAFRSGLKEALEVALHANGNDRLAELLARCDIDAPKLSVATMLRTALLRPRLTAPPHGRARAYRHAHGVLRGGGGASSEAEAEFSLDRVMDLFRLLQTKDVSSMLRPRQPPRSQPSRLLGLCGVLQGGSGEAIAVGQGLARPRERDGGTPQGRVRHSFHSQARR